MNNDEMVVSLRKRGFTYKQIQERTGLCGTSVFYRLRKAGMTKDRWHKPKYVVYTIYGKDGQYLFEGDVRQCADFLGITCNTVRQYCARFKKGLETPVEIHSEKIKGMEV